MCRCDEDDDDFDDYDVVFEGVKMLYICLFSVAAAVVVTALARAVAYLLR